MEDLGCTRTNDENEKQVLTLQGGIPTSCDSAEKIINGMSSALQSQQSLRRRTLNAPVEDRLELCETHADTEWEQFEPVSSRKGASMVTFRAHYCKLAEPYNKTLGAGEAACHKSWLYSNCDIHYCASAQHDCVYSTTGSGCSPSVRVRVT